MKKLFKVILILTLTPIALGLMYYFTATPEDYCKDSEIALESYNKLSNELNFTYDDYERMSSFEYLSIAKKDRNLFTKYGMIKAYYDLHQELEMSCELTLGASKLDKLRYDLYLKIFED